MLRVLRRAEAGALEPESLRALRAEAAARSVCTGALAFLAVLRVAARFAGLEARLLDGAAALRALGLRESFLSSVVEAEEAGAAGRAGDDACAGAAGRAAGDSDAAGRKAAGAGAAGRMTAVVEPPKPGVALPGGAAGLGVVFCTPLALAAEGWDEEAAWGGGNLVSDMVDPLTEALVSRGPKAGDSDRAAVFASIVRPGLLIYRLSYRAGPVEKRLHPGLSGRIKAKIGLFLALSFLQTLNFHPRSRRSCP